MPALKHFIAVGRLTLLLQLCGCAQLLPEQNYLDGMLAVVPQARSGNGLGVVSILGNEYAHPLLTRFPHVLLAHPDHVYVYFNSGPNNDERIVLYSPWVRDGVAREFTNSHLDSEPSGLLLNLKDIAKVIAKENSFLVATILDQDSSGNWDAGWRTAPWYRWLRLRIAVYDGLEFSNETQRPFKEYMLDFDFTAGKYKLYEASAILPRPRPETLVFSDEKSYLRQYGDNIREMDVFEGKGTALPLFADILDKRARWNLSISYVRRAFTFNGLSSHNIRQRDDSSASNIISVYGKKYTHPAYWGSPPFLPVYGDGSVFIYVDHEANISGTVCLVDCNSGLVRTVRVSLADSGDDQVRNFSLLAGELCQMREPLIFQSGKNNQALAGNEVTLFWSGASNHYPFKRTDWHEYVVEINFSTQTLSIKPRK